jgi:hypothetical protein
MNRPVRGFDKLSVGLVTVLVSLLGLAWFFGLSTLRPAPPGLGAVFMGLFLVSLSAMFAASYFYADRSVLLRSLLRFASGFPGLADARMAFVLALVCLVAGLGAMSDAFRSV